MKKLCFIMFILFFSNSLFSQQKEVSFTLDDRDRIMRTEEKLESLRKEMNAKFEGIEYRFNAQDTKFESIESRFDFIYLALGIIITLIVFLLGYNVWDRRTLLHPVKKKTDDNQDRINKWEQIAKQQATEDPKFAEKLRLAGLL